MMGGVESAKCEVCGVCGVCGAKGEVWSVEWRVESGERERSVKQGVCGV